MSNKSFEKWAAAAQYDTTPAAPSTAARVYADRKTQAAYEAWCAGVASASKEIMRSMVAGFSPEELASRGIV